MCRPCANFLGHPSIPFNTNFRIKIYQKSEFHRTVSVAAFQDKTDFSQKKGFYNYIGSCTYCLMLRLGRFWGSKYLLTTRCLEA